MINSMINSVEKNYDMQDVFTNYKMTLSNSEVLFVPLDTENRHHREIQEWIADGGIVIDNGV